MAIHGLFALVFLRGESTLEPIKNWPKLGEERDEDEVNPKVLFWDILEAQRNQKDKDGKQSCESKDLPKGWAPVTR